MIGDLQTIQRQDPTHRNWLETLLCHPGLHALWFYRLAHLLYGWGVPVVPRLISQWARSLTGIEIHPGATIGQGVVIDHGCGVVIGETAIVGDYCWIGQDVTLGGTGKETGKRHPTLGTHIIVEPGAKVLGNIQIGDYARIGAGSVVLRDVPPHHLSFGIPGRMRVIPQELELTTKNSVLPDLEAQVIRVLFDRIKVLEQEVAKQLQATGNPIADSVHTSSHHSVTLDEKSSDSLIEEFLDGSGI